MGADTGTPDTGTADTSAADTMTAHAARLAPIRAGRSRIGFIGLGIMGGPMAANLVRAGFEVAGYNRSEAAIDRLVLAGGTAGKSVADVTRDADVVITMLPDSPDVEAVVLGEGGVFEHADPGLLYIDMSTVRPQTALAVAKAAGDRCVRALDAPVSGGEQGAIEGVLSIMCGGDVADFEDARPVFEAVGATVVRVGPSGAGQTVKAANQLVVAGTLELVAEAIVLMEACGVDAESGLRVLSGGLAGSRVLDRKGSSMLAREFAPGFRVDLHHKDLGIALAVARDAGVVVPAGAVVAQLMAALRAQGDGSLDHGALLKGVERLSGRRGD
jgi:2-hydroxy-3-oxopropionate reductase